MDDAVDKKVRHNLILIWLCVSINQNLAGFCSQNSSVRIQLDPPWFICLPIFLWILCNILTHTIGWEYLSNKIIYSRLACLADSTVMGQKHINTRTHALTPRIIQKYCYGKQWTWTVFIEHNQNWNWDGTATCHIQCNTHTHTQKQNRQKLIDRALDVLV